MNDYLNNHSTGPKTPEGKAKASQNSRTHGLTGKQLVIQGEEAEAFDAHLAALKKDFAPANTIEADLVHDLAMFHLLTQRAIRLQQTQIDQHGVINAHLFNLYLRYQTTNFRAFQTTLKQLQAIQKERKTAEKEFVSEDELYMDQNGQPSTEGIVFLLHPDSPSHTRSSSSPPPPTQKIA